MLTKEELKTAHNNVMTIMENRIMQMTNCDRATANLVANEVLDLDRESEQLLSDEETNLKISKEPNMTKNVAITLDIRVAKMMLGVAGFYHASELSDEEVFEKVLSLIDCYGATSIIKEDMTDKKIIKSKEENQMGRMPQKAFIVKNYNKGWKVLLNDRHIDLAKPIYDSCDKTEVGLTLCRKYCAENGIAVIRECQ